MDLKERLQDGAFLQEVARHYIDGSLDKIGVVEEDFNALLDNDQNFCREFNQKIQAISNARIERATDISLSNLVKKLSEYSDPGELKGELKTLQSTLQTLVNIKKSLLKKSPSKDSFHDKLNDLGI